MKARVGPTGGRTGLQRATGDSHKLRARVCHASAGEVVAVAEASVALLRVGVACHCLASHHFPES
eukprot:1185952-Alexandrium_andersonii.AAC.1